MTEKRELLNLIANTLMTKETLNAQEIEHLRDFGTLPEEVVEVDLAKEEPAVKELEAEPILEKAGSPSINNDVLGKEQEPSTLDLPKSGPELKKQQGIDEDPNRG